VLTRWLSSACVPTLDQVFADATDIFAIRYGRNRPFHTRNALKPQMFAHIGTESKAIPLALTGFIYHRGMA